MDKKQNNPRTTGNQPPFSRMDTTQAHSGSVRSSSKVVDSLREPLRKQKFMQGVRQQWGAVFVICVFIILFMQTKYDINPTPYLEFFMWFAPIMILGQTVSAYNKERYAMQYKPSGIYDGLDRYR